MPGPVFIEGDHVVLRTIEEEDIEFLQEGVNDPRVWRPIGSSTPYNLEQEREFFEEIVSDNDTVQLLVSTEETPVGTVGLAPIDREAGVAEVGYWITPDRWGEGIGTEATALIVQYAFDQLRLHKITARTYEFNEASQRLLRKLGFTEEGVQREQAFIDGEHCDVHWFGILARARQDEQLTSN